MFPFFLKLLGRTNWLHLEMPHPAFANKKKRETCLKCEQEGTSCPAGHFQLDLVGKFSHGSCICGDGHTRADHVVDTEHAASSQGVGGRGTARPVVFRNHAAAVGGPPGGGPPESFEQRVGRLGRLLLNVSSGPHLNIAKALKTLAKVRGE